MVRNNTWNASVSKITIQKITALSLISSVLLVFKFVFGFVPGIEFVTSLFLIFAIFLPYKESIILVIVFNLFNLIFYGFGPWWIMYWPIFIFNVSIGKIAKSIFKNKYLLAIFAFLLGFSIIFWFFLSDLMWYGYSYALLNIISALPINLIEGFSNFLFCIIIAPSLVKVLNIFIPKIWKINKQFHFHKIKRKKLNLVLSLFLSIGSSIALAFTFTYNNIFLTFSQRFLNVNTNNNSNLNNLDINNLTIKNDLLTPNSLLFLQSQMNKEDTATVVIINNKAYVRINKNSVFKNSFASDYLGNSNDEWYVSGKLYFLLGLFLEKFYLNNKVVFSNNVPSIYFTDNNSDKNIFSNVGISSLSMNNSKRIVTISFDKGVKI